MMEESALEFAYEKIDNVTLQALDNLIELLDSKDARTRGFASQAILNRTLPPRKFRSFQLDMKSMKSLDDVLEAQEKIFFKLITAKMNVDEAQAYLSVIETIKNIFMDVKHVHDILTFNEQKKKDDAFQASKNNAS